MQQLELTKAASLWSNFLNICAIPHPSKHEQKLVAWIQDWAKQKKISCVQDDIGNLILNKAASSGYENNTPIILQAHLDMVPQKNNDTEHDFLNDSIKPVIKGEWMHADNTTLGADNGIGMASCLAVLADDTIAHGPLEVLLTTDEETGMTGAFGLQQDALKGKILINTDSEQEGDLYVGCAGGINVNVKLPYEKMESEPTDNAYKISLSGLKGGHSGCDINLGRGNALKLLANILHNLDAIPFHLASFEGGSLRNAIPREAHAVIVCDAQYQNSLEVLINSLQLSFSKKFSAVEEDLQLTLEASAKPTSILTEHSQKQLLTSIYTCDNGVFCMDDSFSNVVQTSSNFGVLTQDGGEQKRFNIQILVRSQVEAEKYAIADKLTKHFQEYGATVRQEGAYPGWAPNTDSAVYKVMETQYQALFAEKPKTMVIHAGLECGLFSSKYPHWDMISFGPTIKFPHSPDEKVNIASVDKYWELLIATLKAID